MRDCSSFQCWVTDEGDQYLANPESNQVTAVIKPRLPRFSGMRTSKQQFSIRNTRPNTCKIAWSSITRADVLGLRWDCSRPRFLWRPEGCSSYQLLHRPIRRFSTTGRRGECDLQPRARDSKAHVHTRPAGDSCQNRHGSLHSHVGGIEHAHRLHGITRA